MKGSEGQEGGEGDEGGDESLDEFRKHVLESYDQERQEAEKSPENAGPDDPVVTPERDGTPDSARSPSAQEETSAPEVTLEAAEGSRESRPAAGDDIKPELQDEGADTAKTIGDAVQEGDSLRSGEDAKDAPGQWKDGAEGLSEETLQEFRERILEEYGPDGLGEDTPEGQLYRMALEERAESGDASDTGTTDEGEGAEDKTTGGPSESGEDSADTQASKGSGTQASAGTEKAAESRYLEALPNDESEDNGEEKRTAQKDEGIDRPPRTWEEAEEDGSRWEAGPTVESQGFEEPDWRRNPGRDETRDDRGNPEPAPEPKTSKAGVADEQVVDRTNDANVSALTEPIDNPELPRLNRSEVPPIQVSFEDQKPIIVKVASGGHEEGMIDTRDGPTQHQARVGGSLVLSGNELPAPDVGRYNRNDNQILVTGLGRSEGPSEERTEQFEPVDLVRRAAKYMESTALLIPQSKLPEHTKEDVIEVRFAREKEPWKEYTSYCRHTPGQGKAYLDLRQVGAEIGEEFRVKAVGVLRPESFVGGYNELRPKGLENTELLLDGSSLKMKVDGAVVDLEQPKFRSHQGNAILEARISGEKSVKITKNLEDYSVRLEDHSPIVSMKRSGRFLTIAYTRTEHDRRPHQSDVEIERLEPKRAHRIELENTHLRMESLVEERSGKIRIEFSVECQAIVRTYWREGRNKSKQEGDYHIGDIGEAVARAIFQESGYSLLPRERFKVGTSVPEHDSANHGPDLLVSKEGHSVVYVKHWRERTKALEEAKTEVSEFRDSKKRIELEQSLGTLMRGGFAIELDWSYNQSSGVIYMEYEKFQ